ncbi:STN domain-containing protein, partial [Emticicia sp.]|uniref:STN domain-containing protein n=1 Tax=Emticicia sp. TaxID=1930953 RepID=UPI003750293C
MKISITQLLMTVFVASVSYAHESYGQESLRERVSILIKNGNLKSVLLSIEKQVDLTFSYQKEVVASNEKINIEFKNETVEDILKKVLIPRNISFQVLRNNQIILTRNLGLGNIESISREPISETKITFSADISIKGT